MRRLFLVFLMSILTLSTWAFETQTTVTFDLECDADDFKKVLAEMTNIERTGENVFRYRTTAFVGTQDITYTFEGSQFICFGVFSSTDKSDLNDLKESFSMGQLSVFKSIESQVALSKFKGDAEFYLDPDQVETPRIEDYSGGR